MLFADARQWLELASFAATVVLAIAAVLGLIQLIIAKRALQHARDDSRIRSQREAIALTTQLCERFAGFIIPKYNEEIADLGRQGLTFYRWTLLDAKFTSASVAERKEADQWLKSFSSDRPKAFRVIYMLNLLEAFALPFASGLSDETVAYPVVASLFFEQVHAFAPYLISLREHTAPSAVSGQFENTVKLYTSWSARAGETKIRDEMKRLVDQQKNLPKPEKIKPIGT